MKTVPLLVLTRWNRLTPALAATKLRGGKGCSTALTNFWPYMEHSCKKYNLQDKRLSNMQSAMNITRFKDTP